MKVNIFSKPEEIDNYIKCKLQAMPRNGGKANSVKNAWTEDEITLKDSIIMEYITVQGLSRTQTAQQICDRWGLAATTARDWVSDACKRFAASFNDNDNQEEQRRIWMERCETILQDAIDTRDKTSALKALDLIGKSMGLYRETKDINLEGDNTIHFDFS